MGIFQNRNMQNVSYRTTLETKYQTARMNLLLVVICTLVNMALIMFGNTTYFLFSASIPYFLVRIGAECCGKFPAEFYEKVQWEGEFYPTSFLAIMLVIAVAILAVYLLCWIFSKKKPAWLIASLVLFGADTLGMFYLYGFNLSMILDILFHAWILIYLIIGVVANHKLKNLPEDEPQAEPQNNGFSDVYNSTFNSQSSDSGVNCNESGTPASIQDTDTQGADNTQTETAQEQKNTDDGQQSAADNTDPDGSNHTEK